MCKFCDIENKIEDNFFTDEEMNEFIMKVYSGVVTIKTLDLAHYLKTARKLTEGVFDGYGKGLQDTFYLSPDYVMLSELKQNVYIFSGAKQYQEVRQMSSFLTKGNDIVPFNEFKKSVEGIFKEYNQNYLNAEYNSAIAQARSADQWQQIQSTKANLPLLQYQTRGDGRVRPEHAELNMIIKPVNDPFWDKYYPPNGWNCRCDVIQLDEGEITDTNSLVVNNVPPEFQFNSGKQKIVFSNEHPYYKVAPKDKALARNNFNLPLPSTPSPVNS